MCTAKQNGGKRCPIHQRTNIAAIKVASHLGGLTVRQTERLFAELRREGRDAEVLTPDQQKASLQSIKASAENTDINDDVVAGLEVVPVEEAATDGASGYAQRLIIERSKVRGDNLSKRFREVAEQTGYTESEVAEKFEEFYSQVDISRGAAVPEEYNQNTRRAAVLANLPYDKASVVAFEKLKNLNPAQNERRVTHQQAAEGSHIKSFGYDDGRLEVVFNSNPDVIYAYRNIPDEVWERFSVSSSPGRVYSQEIRGNQDYMYEDREASEQDAFRQRCAACGQFRAAVHACEEREHRNDLEDAGLTPDQIRAEVEAEQNNLPASMINVEDVNDTSDDNIVKVVQENNSADEEEPDSTEATDQSSTDTVLPTSLTYMNNLPEESEPSSLNNYSPTVELQRKPEKYDSSELILNRRSEPYQRLVTTTSNTINSALIYNEYLQKLDEDTIALIRNSSPHETYLIGQKEINSDISEVIRVVDNRKMSMSTHFYHGPDEDGNIVTGYIYSTTRRGKTYDANPISAAQQQDEVHFENDKLSKLIDSGKVALIPMTTTKTRKYTFDANLSKQPLISAGNASSFKKAIKENKIAVLPITVEYPSYVKDDSVDDQGYEFGVSSGTTVSGELAFQRNPETGVMEPVVTTENKLRCTCYEYRNNYRCVHVNHVFRHAGNVAQQMLPIVASSRVSDTSEDNQNVDVEGEPISPLWTTALMNRSDVSVLTDDSGEEYVSFGENISYDNKRTTSSGVMALMRLPERFRPVDPSNPTPNELESIEDYVDLASKMLRVETQRSLTPARAALKRSDVSIPIVARFGWGNNSSVSGTIRLSRIENSLEETKVKESDLKCTCPDYAAGYNCKHINFVEEQPFPFITHGARNQQVESHSVANAKREYASRIARENEIRSVMIRHSMTHEEAAEEVATRRATQDRAQIEREERGRIRRINANNSRVEEARLAFERAKAEKEEAAKANKRIADTLITYRKNMMEKWENVEEGYTDNSKEFYSDYKAALKKERNDDEVIPFRTSNVTDGVCADGPGTRSFGVELEFDIRYDYDRKDALQKIGEELHAAGLIGDSEQKAYHEGQRSGYSKWSFEKDETVDAELVSPIMKDTPEDWEQLRTAIDIIKRNGGTASVRTGSHVHVSTGSYENSSAKHVELMRVIKQNEDTMYRLASDPSRGRHRGTRWCAPNVLEDFVDVPESVKRGNRIFGSYTPRHGSMMNLAGSDSGNHEKSNVEFRVWDGTLDPAIIQQQIAISVATVDYAERSTIVNKGSKRRKARNKELGANRGKEREMFDDLNIKSHTEETFAEYHKDVAAFFDNLFRRKEDRANAMSLFAMNNWQS